MRAASAASAENSLMAWDTVPSRVRKEDAAMSATRLSYKRWKPWCGKSIARVLNRSLLRSDEAVYGNEHQYYDSRESKHSL